jgi:hypothetical protein
MSIRRYGVLQIANRDKELEDSMMVDFLGSIQSLYLNEMASVGLN